MSSKYISERSYLILENAEITRRIEERERRREDIKRFVEAKAQAKSNSGTDESIVDEAFVIAIQNHLNDEVIKNNIANVNKKT